MECWGSSVVILGGCHGRVVAVGFKSALVPWVFVDGHGIYIGRERTGKREKVTTEGR
jgi:hypothetical protein